MDSKRCAAALLVDLPGPNPPMHIALLAYQGPTSRPWMRLGGLGIGSGSVAPDMYGKAGLGQQHGGCKKIGT